MNKKELQVIAQAAAKNIKTEADLNEFRQMLTKITVEAALNAELDDHLGFAKHEQSEADNNRNGYTSKTLQTEDGQFELDTPRDRAGSFKPRLVKKHQRRFTSMDDKILFLYAQGMTTREIVTTFKEMYGADVSAILISNVTDAVIEQVVEWQSRPLDAIYPIVYLDCIVVKIRQDKQVINKAIYLALGVNMEGHKELLGMWLAENEGAKFGLNVLTELQNCGVKDILIACVDGLSGNKVCLSQVPGAAAIAIDGGLDDGSGATGSVRATPGTSGVNTAPTNTVMGGGGVYSEDNVYTLCYRM